MLISSSFTVIVLAMIAAATNIAHRSVHFTTEMHIRGTYASGSSISELSKKLNYPVQKL